MRRRELVDGRVEQLEVRGGARHLRPDLLLSLRENVEEVAEDPRQRLRLHLVGEGKVEAAGRRVHCQSAPECLLARGAPPAPQRLRLDASARRLPTIDGRREVGLVEENLLAQRLG